jgi:hypothetical protein
VASIEVLFPSDTTLTSVTRQNTDNLPAHVKGIAEWKTVGPYTGYYIPGNLTRNNKPIPIEFINNSWFSLVFIESEQSFFTCKTQSITRENTYRLGFWRITDPEHPEYTAQAPIAIDPPEESTFGLTDPSRPASRASLLRLVGRSVRRARGGVILKSTTSKGRSALMTESVQRRQ